MDPATTRQRILTEALRLFSERGYRGTTVAEIEAAAGLSPGAGGLYRHFRSKRDVVRAVLEHAIEQLEAVRSVAELLPLGDLRSELTLLARWGLQQLREQTALAISLAHAGEDARELLGEMHERVVRRGHREALDIARRLAKERQRDGLDVEAFAAVALSALVQYRVAEHLFGAPPGDIEEERFVAAWVDVWMRFLDSKGGDGHG